MKQQKYVMIMRKHGKPARIKIFPEKNMGFKTSGGFFLFTQYIYFLSKIKSSAHMDRIKSLNMYRNKKLLWVHPLQDMMI